MPGVKSEKATEVAVKPIYVAWYDSVRADDGWEETETVAADYTKVNELLHVSVGFLVAENDHCVLISSHASAANEKTHVCQTMQIPKVAIIERHWIELPELPKLAALRDGEQPK